MYLDLKSKQKGLYNSYLKTSRGHIFSFSQELFFEKTGDEITVKPMKGTAPRGIDGADDDRIGRGWACDKKNLSENLMIIDLLRNDLSRMSEKGSVKVEKLYELEKYPTLFQLTSTIKSKLKKSTGMRDIIMSLFPSRSVTGAPKIRAMEIINDFESTPRGVYCGAMGYFEPGGNAKFNVSIRTAAIESGKGIFGAGGGIIADSEPELEYKELKLKAKFLTEPGDDSRIIETMLYDGYYNLLEEHLYRMESSVQYFDFIFDRDGARKKLKKLRRKLKGGKNKIRLLCAASGGISVSEYPVGNYPAEFKITLSDKHPHSADKFLYHKTTNRDIYNRELKKAQKAGFYDVVFFNQNSCLTEGARTNVYMKKNGRVLTPSAECGLLNGITRKDMIEKGKVEEKRLYKKDLISADAVYISNSIIGFKKALLLFK